MRIIEIKYEHRIPVKQYESEVAGATAAICEADDPAMSMKQLQNFVNASLVKESTPIEKEIEKKKEEPEQEVKTEEPKKETKKKTKRKTTKKKELYLYNREIESHKKELYRLLTELAPGWQKNIEKASQLSFDLSGKVDLYNKDGDVTEAFKKAVIDGMK